MEDGRPRPSNHDNAQVGNRRSGLPKCRKRAIVTYLIPRKNTIIALLEGRQMKFLTTDEVRMWCEVHKLGITPHRFLDYDETNSFCLSIVLEGKPHQVIALADYLVPTWKDVPFHGALLWVRERGIWGDFAENTGAMIFEQMRLARGEKRTLRESPGYLFEATELIEMHSYFVVPLLFGWDAFLIPEGSDYFLFVSHHGVVQMVCRTQPTYDQLRRRLHAWNPKEDKTYP